MSLILPRILRTVIEKAIARERRRRARFDLVRLNEHLLRDIGLTNAGDVIGSLEILESAGPLGVDRTPSPAASSASEGAPHNQEGSSGLPVRALTYNSA